MSPDFLIEEGIKLINEFSKAFDAVSQINVNRFIIKRIYGSFNMRFSFFVRVPT